MNSIFQENLLRPTIFISSLFFLIIVSGLLPYRNQKGISKNRVLSNLLLGTFNSLVLKLILPLSLIQLSALCLSSGWGVFNFITLINNGSVISIILSVLFLDILIYWQHRLTHIIPFLWRLHRVHHSDTEFDTTSGVRFHPLEIILSYVIKAGFIVALGLPPVSILIFEIILSSSSLFNHSNISFPEKIEQFLRLFIVTPDLHRIHHSTTLSEANSNYSFSFSLWDRLFFSFTENSKENQKTMKIGLSDYREIKDQKLLSLLLQPFKSKES